MKKGIGTVIAPLMAVLLLWAGGYYGKGPPANAAQDAPTSAELVEGQDTNEMPLSPGAVRVGPARMQIMGVKVATVEKTPMTYILRLYGRVVPDETRTYRVNSSTDCWIRKVSDVTTGSIVAKGQILAEALAPVYYNAQLTYLIALDNLDRIKRQLGGQLRHQQTDLANNQIRVAVQALQNLGITDAQTEELANKRQAQPYLQVRSPADGVVLNRNVTLNQWFKASDEFYTIADIGKVWVYADVYEDEAMHMRPGMTVAVKHTQMGKTFGASVGEVLPLFDPAARALEMRLDVDNPQYDLRPDMFVDVEIPITMPPSLHVPADAVLDEGTMAIVYVDAGNGAFEPRRVQTGWRLGRQVEIKGGLQSGEKIAVSGNFLIDSESRMEIAALGPDLKLHVDPVCGRFVDGEEAELLERTATYANETFYFSSKECKEDFEKEPEKYVRKGQLEQKKGDRAALSEIKRTWADLLRPLKGDRSIKDDVKSGNKKKDTPGEYPTTPEVVDWNGPDKEGAPPPKWSKGWGGFPGARYLGIKKEDKKQSSGQSDGTAAAVDNKASDARIGGPEDAVKPDDPASETKSEIQQQPASGQPQSSSE